MSLLKPASIETNCLPMDYSGLSDYVQSLCPEKQADIDRAVMEAYRAADTAAAQFGPRSAEADVADERALVLGLFASQTFFHEDHISA